MDVDNCSVLCSGVLSQSHNVSCDHMSPEEGSGIKVAEDP